jgi:hypothetical protein
MRTKEFNERLRRHPFDEKLWSELVDFQDEVRGQFVNEFSSIYNIM